MRRKIIALIIPSLLVIAYLTGMIYEALAERSDQAAFAPLGRLVDVNGRQAHIFCSGENQAGSPTVILEAGGGDNLYTWYALQAEISALTRVCSYDRAGLGWSEPASAQRTAGQIADELAELLQAAGEPGPYLLAGHSFGGLVARIFAARHPQEVAGLLLIDSTNAEDILTYSPVLLGLVPMEVYAGSLLQKAGLLRLTGLDSQVLSEAFLYLPAEVHPPARALYLTAGSLWITAVEMSGMVASAREAVAAGPLGDIPLIAYVTPAEEDGSLPDQYLERFQALSTRSQVEKIDCGHYVHLERPELVLAAIKRLLENTPNGFSE